MGFFLGRRTIYGRSTTLVEHAIGLVSQRINLQPWQESHESSDDHRYVLAIIGKNRLTSKAMANALTLR